MVAFKYFGTDGIRGKVGSDTMNEDFLERVGNALGAYLRERHPSGDVHVVLGRDTRESGESFEKAFIKGILPWGVDVDCLSVVPTPAVAFWVDELEADNGIMITASHNPSTDNGIKFFNAHGKKQPVEKELTIDQLIDSGPIPGENFSMGKVLMHENAVDVYVEHVLEMMPRGALAGWKIVLDTANGASVETGRRAFEALGVDVVAIGDSPNGKNINDGVGSEHPATLVKAVKSSGARLGVAFDGDGDRVLLCDENGEIVPGEQLLGVMALHILREHDLSEDTFVTTIQSNLGFDRAVVAAGGKVIRSEVGDRNVIYKMLECDSNIGGESSGHIILREYAWAGDALVAAIKVFKVLLESKRTLADLRKEIPMVPSLMESIRVKEQKPLEGLVNLNIAIKEIEGELGKDGRLLVRYSGTEPKIRLLVEAVDSSALQPIMQRLKAAVGEDLEVSS